MRDGQKIMILAKLRNAQRELREARRLLGLTGEGGAEADSMKSTENRIELHCHVVALIPGKTEVM